MAYPTSYWDSAWKAATERMQREIIEAFRVPPSMISAVDDNTLYAERLRRHLSEPQGSRMDLPPLKGCTCSDCEQLRRSMAYPSSSSSYEEQIRREMEEMVRRSLYFNPVDVRFGSSPSASKSPIFPCSGGSMYPSYSTDITSAEGLASVVRAIAEKNPGTDFSGITAAIEKVNAEHKNHIEESLEGVANLAVMSKATTRRFIIAYWHKGKACTVEGVEFADTRTDTSKDCYDSLVHLHPQGDAGYSIGRTANTMKKLRETLETKKIPHVITYFA